MFVFYAVGLLAFTMFVIIAFATINYPKSWDKDFPGQCEDKGNGCVRVALTKKYRANEIEMKYPITFKNATSLRELISYWTGNMTSIPNIKENVIREDSKKEAWKLFA